MDEIPVPSEMQLANHGVLHPDHDYEPGWVTKKARGTRVVYCRACSRETRRRGSQRVVPTDAQPSERALAAHAASHPDHDYVPRVKAGTLRCDTCLRAQWRAARRSSDERRTVAERAVGFPWLEGGLRTRALSPGVGVTLGQMAAIVATAQAAGAPDGSRIEVVTERRRGRQWQRIAAIWVQPRDAREAAS